MSNKIRSSLLAVGIACTALLSPLTAMARQAANIIVVICDDAGCNL
ncbi:hypothetical protein [Stenotrophomonas sp.]|nr:hypothetical protein [Stenotrophomonas sp.]